LKGRIALAVLLLTVSGALAAFLPSIRIDHQDLYGHSCISVAIAVGRQAPVGQPLYVVAEADSWYGMSVVRSDIVFQMSTNGGATWLSDDKVLRHGAALACYPEITTDADGNPYVVYFESDSMFADAHQFCVGSTDGGATWSAPVKVDHNPSEAHVGAGCVAADAAGNLFCAWSDSRTGSRHIWTSVSTDQGATWSPDVRACDDAGAGGCQNPEVCIQPGTNSYLVVVPHQHAYLYRSTDRGQTFQPGVQLDTLEYASKPHVVADSQHVICDYYGSGDNGFTEARTLYTPPDTWGPCSPVTDTLFNSYYSAPLALSADGGVHAALGMNYQNGRYDVYYASSSDHGASWSGPERVNDDTSGDKASPDIGADSAGCVYVAWEDSRGGIWFSTNHAAGVSESQEQRTFSRELQPTVCRRLPAGAVAFDAMGRRVLNPKPGIYFLRTRSTVAPRKILLVE
jgi:hypothetical protein